MRAEATWLPKKGKEMHPQSVHYARNRLGELVVPALAHTHVTLTHAHAHRPQARSHTHTPLHAHTLVPG